MVKIVADNLEKVLVDPAIILQGRDGKDGLRGPEGMPGRDGVDGRDGKDGKDGRDGVDGKDGISYWIEYDKKTNTLIFKNDGGKKSPDPIKLPPTAKGWGFAAGSGRGGGQVQADWNQTNKNDPTFIKNKPEIHNVQIRRVETLPATGESYVLYLVPSDDPETDNVYDEYIWAVQEDQSYALEKIGTTEVDLSGYIKGVQINGTDLTPDANNKVNVPKASNSTLGVMAVGSGLAIQQSGSVYIVAATESNLINKLNASNPVVSTNLNIAIREGLGNNSLIWTEEYKESARDTIGAASLYDFESEEEAREAADLYLDSMIRQKENKATIQTLSATDSITLADNTIYNGGEQTSLTIALPATDTVGFICDVDFSSGNTATTLSYSLPDIFWAGVDVAYDATAQKDIFTPVANKRYTIIFYFDGVNYNGRVGGV